MARRRCNAAVACRFHTQLMQLSIGYEPQSPLSANNINTTTTMRPSNEPKTNIKTKHQPVARTLATAAATVSQKATALRTQPLNVESPTVVTTTTVDEPITASINDVLTVEMKKEIIDNGRHFSKIATQFKFDDTISAYLRFEIQFKPELESYSMEHTLIEPPKIDSPVSMLQQQTVYNMIVRCVPTKVMPLITTNLLNKADHNAYTAWRILRRHYVGDEATYLHELENRFQRISWLDDQDFNELEVQFEQIISELELAGQIKPDHAKKAVFMNAIESSNKKDARGLHVFDRFNTISKIHYAKTFKEWMVQLRIEGQQIAQELAKRRSEKRTRSDPSVRTPPDEPDSLPVSAVTPMFIPPPSWSSSSSSTAHPNRSPPIHVQTSVTIISVSDYHFTITS